eukprot:Em0016g354a
MSRRAVLMSGIQLNDFMKELSRHIGKDYKKLARALGIGKTDIDSLEIANPGDLKEQIAQFFILWQRKEGRNATIEKLKQALREAELLEALENMEKFNKDMPISLREEDDSVIIETTPSPPITFDTRLDLPRNECAKSDTGSFERHRSLEGSVVSSSHSMGSISDRCGQTPHSSSPSINLADVLEEDIDVTFSFPSDTSAQSILNKCKTNDTVCVITGSSNTFECKISGKLDNCCRTLQGVLRCEMHRLKQCKSKNISVNDPTEWSQMVGSDGCINKAIRHLSGAALWISDSDSFPKSCCIKGFPKQIQVAEELIKRAKWGQGKELTSEATAQNIFIRLKRDLEDLCHFVFME